MEVLSQTDCDLIMENLNSIDKNVEEYCSDIQRTINLFNENPTVQSFYASGGFGKGMQAELEKVMDGVRRYYQVINSEGGLIQTTKKVVSNQMELLNKSNNVGR